MNKVFGFLGIVALIGLSSSCGGDKDKGKTEETDSAATESTDMDMTGMIEHDLSSAGLNTKIMVADEISPSGEHFPVRDSVILEGISWQVSVGEKYSIIIEEPEAKGDQVKMEKKRVEETGIYDVKYLVDKPNAILYEANLKGGAGSKPFYHVFGVVKMDGRELTIKSNPAGEFNKGQAERMLKTIMALQKGA